MRHGLKAIRRIVNQPIEAPYKERRLCTSCGAKFSKNARFCKFCGKKVGFQPIKVQTINDHKNRISFFCQLDNEKHPAMDSAYQCEQCARHVCDSCYREINMVGLSNCSCCGGNLIQIQ